MKTYSCFHVNKGGVLFFTHVKKRMNQARLLMLCSGLFCCLGLTTLSAQTQITTTQLLGNQMMLKGDSLLQRNLDFLKNSEQGMPFVEDMEFRTETDELDFSRQEYLFRMSFNNKKARKVQDGMTENNTRFYEVKAQILKEEELVNRYELIIEWYYLQKDLSHFFEKKILLEDKQVVYRKMLTNAVVVNITDLLKIDEDIQELDRDILQAQLQQKEIIRQLFTDFPNPGKITLDSTTWISLDKMELVLREAKDDPVANLDQALQMLRVNTEQLKYDMEKAESKRILDFVQLKYAGRNSLNVQKEFSVGVGVQIPTKSTGRVKINEAMLDMLDEEYQQEMQTATLHKRIDDRYAQFYALLEEYNLIQQQIKDSDLQRVYDKYSANGAIHPITLLRMKETFLKNRRALRRLEEEACFTFLEILTYKGLLSQTPTVNYLSEGLKSF